MSVGADVTSDGRLFQRRHPATGNARSPTVDNRVTSGLFRLAALLSVDARENFLEKSVRGESKEASVPTLSSKIGASESSNRRLAF